MMKIAVFLYYDNIDPIGKLINYLRNKNQVNYMF